MCNQAYSSNKKRSIRYFKFFASDKNAKIALVTGKLSPGVKFLITTYYGPRLKFTKVGEISRRLRPIPETMKFNENFGRKLMQKREKSLFYSSELFFDYHGIVLRYLSRKVIDNNLANLGFSLAALRLVAEKKILFSGGQASYL